MSSASETTSLLPCNIPDSRRGCNDFLSTTTVPSQTRTFGKEFAILSRYSLPVFGSQLLEFSIMTVPILSVGRSSTNALSAIGLASLTANVTAFNLMQGFASALDTMLPSACTSSEPRLVGLWSQRMLILMVFIMVPIYGLWFNIEAIFLSLKQDPEVASLSSLYLRWLSLGLPAYAFNCVSRKYFQCQGCFSVPTLIISIVALINVTLNYLLVWGPPPVRLGFIGAPIATAISFNLVSILSIAHCMFYLPRKAWCPPSMRMFSNLHILAILGAGGAGQMASEWCALEIIAFEASLFGPVRLASQSVLQGICSMFFQIFAAISVSTAVRIGNLLGEANATRSRVATRASFALTLGLCSILNAFIFAFRSYWAYIFTHDLEVVELVTDAVCYVGIFLTFDATLVIALGNFRARGKQDIGALLYFIGYIAIGIPFGIYFAFYRALEVRGLWLGLTGGLLCASACAMTICLRTEWEREVWKAIVRLKENHDHRLPESQLEHSTEEMRSTIS